MANASLKQKAHYERIHDDYEQHYFDESSMNFRDRFVYRPLFGDFNFNGLRVADLASGSGHNSVELLKRFPQAEVVGFDISSKACETYQKLTHRPAHQLDLTSGTDCGIQVDAAMIFGGLHHCIADLPGTFRTIAHMLKPGGTLFMYEPNRQYVLEGLRAIWYRMDQYFEAETERALNHDEIASLASKEFSPLRSRYMGGPAYFLIYNSLLFRIPLGWKKYLAPPLFLAESAYNCLPGRHLYPYFVAQWRRN